MSASEARETRWPRRRVAVPAPRISARWIRRIAPPLVFAAGFITLWQLSIFNDLFGLKTFTVPLPSDILSALSEDRQQLWKRFGETFSSAALGFAFGNGVGLLLACGLLALPRPVARRIGMVFTAVQALPIVAVAPIVALWINSISWFKIATVAILTFPSMLIYAYRGMTNVEIPAIELAASYRASPSQVLWYIRLPHAVPQIFTALRYTSVLTLVGVVVAEIFRSHDGLGYEIADALQSFSSAEAWAAVAILSITGILAYSLLTIVERLCFPWSIRRSQ